jgi:hydrogenase maturation protein HypF
VQHHHAHLAACLAEHGEIGPAVGAIFDGAGYGTDGTVWGGEILVGDLRSFERAGHLLEVRMPGGDRAAREPWRMACAWRGERLPGVDADRWDAVAELARSELSPLTTSVGRLFDAAAAICGGPLSISFEGQAAMELEALCDPGEPGTYLMPVGDDLVIDPRPALRALAGDGPSRGVRATRFHRALARATAQACSRACDAHTLDTVVLSGGVFQNRRLLEETAELLELDGLRVLTAREVPPNDGGIAYGQAAVAAARMGEWCSG